MAQRLPAEVGYYQQAKDAAWPRPARCASPRAGKEAASPLAAEAAGQTCAAYYLEDLAAVACDEDRYRSIGEFTSIEPLARADRRLSGLAWVQRTSVLSITMLLR